MSFLKKMAAFGLATVTAASMLSVSAFAATNELTGLPVSDAIANQRPVAVMVDNEKIALKHYGVSEADVVYEMMNSTANGRITRLMCLYKDWQNLGQTGSIRSTRTTNIMMAGEYDAILVHDGGPVYVNEYFARPYAASSHLSGGFTRVNNGKRREFTEYAFGKEIASRCARGGVSTTYTQFAPERPQHFLFYPTDTELVFGSPATTVNLAGAFPHNKSQLLYNAGTKTYDYYEYGSKHVDGEDGKVATFKNVILQNTTFTQLDQHGYLTYNVIGTGTGYFITNGKCSPITWTKTSDTGMTHYYETTGKEIQLNVGKTYIGIIPSDGWGTVGIY